MINYCANYNKAVRKAVEVLEDYEIPQAPVDLDLIFDALSREISLFTYGEYMKLSGWTRQEVINHFDSELGVCCYKRTTNQYVILYNETKSDPFIHFTLAHELGHIFLDHHQVAGTEILNRSFLTQEQYDEYEKEANCFARNLLSPAPLAWTVIEEGKSRNQNIDIQNAFDITESAANVRINFIRRDLRDYTDPMKQLICKIFIRYRKRCCRCRSLVPMGAKYCVICGNKRIGKSLRYNPLPPDIAANKNGFFYACPRCGNQDLDEHSRYCMICGLPLFNYCSGHGQDGKTHKRHLNRSFARYCEECGAETFYGHLDIKIRMKDSEVKYTDGVDYNENTLRVNVCPVCGNDEFGSNAEYCRICGTNLYNKCEGEADQDINGNIIYLNQHANPSNARYCEICGKPTYFSQRKILPTYQVYLQRQEEEDARFMALALEEEENISYEAEPPQAYIEDTPPFSDIPEFLEDAQKLPFD